MLGGLAYQDPNHAILRNFEPGDITAINQKKDDSITAVLHSRPAAAISGGSMASLAPLEKTERRALRGARRRRA